MSKCEQQMVMVLAQIFYQAVSILCSRAKIRDFVSTVLNMHINMDTTSLVSLG